jgi:WhiB family transcriptional regulator, redox-sensing transcriptional regulator
VENWKLAGACRGEDPDIFFPITGLAEGAAKRICTTCIVRAQCLDVALKGEEHGIWGGTNERERKRIIRRYYKGSKDLYAAAATV